MRKIKKLKGIILLFIGLFCFIFTLINKVFNNDLFNILFMIIFVGVEFLGLYLIIKDKSQN